MSDIIEKKEVGKRIRAIRKNLGLSMDELGKRIDEKTKSGTVSNWETGKNLPNNERLEKIANLGNVSVDYILNGEKDLEGNEMEVPGMSYYSHKVIYKRISSDTKKFETPRYCINLIQISDNKRNFPSVVRSTLFVENKILKAVYFENYDFFIYDFPINVEALFENRNLINFDTFIFNKGMVDKNFLDTFCSNLFKDIAKHLEDDYQCSIDDDVKVFYQKQRKIGKTKINIK